VTNITAIITKSLSYTDSVWSLCNSWVMCIINISKRFRFLLTKKP